VGYLTLPNVHGSFASDRRGVPWMHAAAQVALKWLKIVENYPGEIRMEAYC
jgi:hypothetical protein